MLFLLTRGELISTYQFVERVPAEKGDNLVQLLEVVIDAVPQGRSSGAMPRRPTPLTDMVVVCCAIAFSKFPADRTVVNGLALDDSFDASGVPRF